MIFLVYCIVSLFICMVCLSSLLLLWQDIACCAESAVKHQLTNYNYVCIFFCRRAPQFWTGKDVPGCQNTDPRRFVCL